MADTTTSNAALNHLWLFGFISIGVGIPVMILGLVANVGVVLVGAAFSIVGGLALALYLAVKAVLSELKR